VSKADPDKSLSYEEAKRMAIDPDRSKRLYVAASTDIAPEILYYMVDDPDAEVRCLVAGNAVTPRQADSKLANDENPAVRQALACKIAQEASGIVPSQQKNHASLTIEILDTLARDQMPVVRQVVAEVLKCETQVPHQVIQRLARDIDIMVAAPVLEFSPLLGDADLIEIIEGSPISGALTAISRRDGVSDQVSASIADSNDTDAIVALLENSTAQLREDTLDSLIEKSRKQTRFQEPLVRRPKLPVAAACKLATFVADSLLDVLQTREDLDDALMDAIRISVRNRLSSTFGEDEGIDLPPERLALKREYQSALALHAKTPLTESVVERSVDYEHWDFVTATLAVMSGCALKFAQEVMDSKDPELVVALCWKSGVSVAIACDVLKLQLGLDIPEGCFGAEEYPQTHLAMEQALLSFAERRGLTMLACP